MVIAIYLIRGGTVLLKCYGCNLLIVEPKLFVVLFYILFVGDLLNKDLLVQFPAYVVTDVVSVIEGIHDTWIRVS